MKKDSHKKLKVFVMMSPHKKVFVRGKPEVAGANKKKVFVMMSGGVDSSVAAFLLSEKKEYEVIGCFIKGYNVDGCQEKEAQDARRVAEFLNIPFYTIDLEKEYKKLVVDYMIAGYKKGITPNPDVMCNKEIKFGLFLEKAIELGADYVATGHYIRLRCCDSNFPEGFNTKKYENTKSKDEKVSYIRKKLVFSSLYEAKDLNKDQSYFLWTLTQEQLKRCLFPIGEYLKSNVREIARKAKIPVAEKKDSQGICFLGQFNVKDFLKQFLPSKKGNVVTADGKKIGKHDGAWFYTIGQRHGLNLGTREKKKGDSRPYYVAGKDIKKNIIIVAEGEGNPALSKKEILITQVNFQLPITNYRLPMKVLARVRYRQPLVKATLIVKSKKQIVNRSRKNKLPITDYQLLFTTPQKFIAPGQSAVFYNKKGELLGGGVIK